MKITRLIIGLVVIGLALWILVGEQMAGASANAVVNAPVVTVRSEVAGTLSLSDITRGAQVAEGEVIASITDPLVDTIRLNDLLMERDFQAAILQRVSSRIEEEEALVETLDDRTRIFREERLAELRTRLERARARLALLEGQDGLDEEAQAVAEAVDEAPQGVPGEPRTYALALEHARERVEILEIAVGAAEQNVFLGDGYNDAPNAEQRAVELQSIIAGLRADATEAAARLGAIDQRIQRERVRVNSLTGGEIQSPVDGLLWQVLQADGVTVQRGDPVLRLVDCQNTFVTLSVTEQIYNTLERGQAVRFRFEGAGRVFDGTVGRLAGSGAATVYETLAVAPSERQLERYDVAAIIPELNADPELGCAIGRTGRVFFDTRPLDGLRALFR